MKGHRDVVLEKMFAMVGEKYTLEFVKQPEWFCLQEWGKETEDKFAEWLFGYLKRNKEARKELMARPTSDRVRIKQVVMEFIFQYGWKTKEAA
jgi:DNA segregation ATPase FtsK/SpoIIIE-like protein